MGHLDGHRARVPENNAQLVDIQALLERAGIAATPVYTHAGHEPVTKLVAYI